MKNKDNFRDWNDRMYLEYRDVGWGGIIDMIHKKRLNLMKKLIKANRSSYVLDIGCGDGMLISELPSDYNIIGLDISKYALSDARKKCMGSVLFILSDATENLPFKKERFDVVVVGELLEHVHDPEKILKNIQRVVKKNGRVIISTPNEILYLKIKKILKKTRVLSFLFNKLFLEESKWHIHHDFDKKKALKLIIPYFKVINVFSVLGIHHVFLSKENDNETKL